MVAVTETVVGLVAQVGVTHFSEAQSPAATAIASAVLLKSVRRPAALNSSVEVIVVSVVSLSRNETVDCSFDPAPATMNDP